MSEAVTDDRPFLERMFEHDLSAFKGLVELVQAHPRFRLPVQPSHPRTLLLVFNGSRNIKWLPRSADLGIIGAIASLVIGMSIPMRTARS